MLYVRQQAWLACPPPHVSESRGQLHDRNGSEPYDMPETCGMEYLLEWLTEIGLYAVTGMGITGISWERIKGWSDLSGIDPTPFEARALIELSNAYANEVTRSTGKQTVAPWSKIDVDRKEVADKMKSVLSQFKRGPIRG